MTREYCWNKSEYENGLRYGTEEPKCADIGVLFSVRRWGIHLPNQHSLETDRFYRFARKQRISVVHLDAKLRSHLFLC